VLGVREVGARGDGVAEGPVFVPFTLPGERVRAQVSGERASLLAVEAASPEQVDAPCPHFTACGGCQLQHWAEPSLLAWKREAVVRALAHRGLEAEVAATVPAWGEGRRRASLHAVRTERGLRLGFIERAGSRIEDVSVCPVLAPALANTLSGLRAIAEAFVPARGRLSLAVLATEAGLDVALEGAGLPHDFDRARLESAAALADAHDLARLSFDDEPAVTRRTPFLTIGAARVVPPPGGFAQATVEAERLIAGLVLDAVVGARRVADLFAGLGTFALRLAARAEVHAVEADAALLAALKAGADGAAGLKPVTTEVRDLQRAPLAPVELKRFEAVVLDPPRAGARGQAEAIARSDLARVVSVSCEPATFARDARTLVDAGFRLARVTPLDQFRWSPHVEVVGVFER
jgi:23S rRNA (uracil1939-C5)-methyltransferase